MTSIEGHRTGVELWMSDEIFTPICCNRIILVLKQMNVIDIVIRLLEILYQELDVNPNISGGRLKEICQVL